MRECTIVPPVAIEIRERYGDVVKDRWPVSVDPLPDELLSSWINRLALANGMAPRPFSRVIGCGDGMWAPRLDLHLPSHLATFLCEQSGLPSEAISTMILSSWALTPLLLPLRESVHRGRSTWIQYCPQCLAEDETPYFRRQWRLASRVSCFAHGCGLRDRCPACRTAISSYHQEDLVPQHFCASCGYDLRAAPRVSIKSDARRLERVIGDILKVEAAGRFAETSDLISRIRRALVATGSGLAVSITSLSTSARIRCFEALSAMPIDWLVDDADLMVACRRAMIAAAGAHDRMIANLVGFLERSQSTPKPVCSTRPSARLADLLAAYSRVVGGVPFFKPHIQASGQTSPRLPPAQA